MSYGYTKQRTFARLPGYATGYQARATHAPPQGIKKLG